MLFSDGGFADFEEGHFLPSRISVADVDREIELSGTRIKAALKNSQMDLALTLISLKFGLRDARSLMVRRLQ